MTARTFTLRHTDAHTGITTDLAHGAVFADGTAVLHWADTIASTAVYTSLDNLQAATICDSSTTVVDGTADFATIETIVELTLQRDDLAEECCQARAALHAAQERLDALEAAGAGTDQQEKDGQPHPRSPATPIQDAFLSQECARLQHENEQLRAENGNYRLTADQDKTYLDNADAQVAELREQVRLLTAEHREHEDTAVRLRKERDGLQRELADLRRKSDDTLTAAAPTAEQVSRAEAQNKALARRCAELEAEVADAWGAAGRLNRKYGEANRYMEKFAADAHALRTDAAAAGKRVEAAEQTIETMGAQLDEAAAREASLRAELDEANTAGTRMLDELYGLRTTSARQHSASRRDAQTLKNALERETALRADVSRLAAGEKRWKNKALLAAELAAQYRDELEQLHATRTVQPADPACPCLPTTPGNLPDPTAREADQAHAEDIAGDQHDADAPTSPTSRRAGGHAASTKGCCRHCGDCPACAETERIVDWLVDRAEQMGEAGPLAACLAAVLTLAADELAAGGDR